jgi:ABC-2 type transport system ATP-binding protein
MDTIVDIRNVSVSYGNGKNSMRALNGLCLKLNRGEIFGFIGPNGAGKTTTIKCLVGLHGPNEGEVLIGGHKAGSRSARAMIGYLPEVSYYYWYLTAPEYLKMCGKICGLKRIELKNMIGKTLDLVGLDVSKKKLIKHFSKGMIQKLGLAQALLHDPELYVLDEPTSGLDPLARMRFRDIILSLRDRGKTVFFSSHELSEVELISNRVAIIKDGSIVDEGPMEDILKPFKAYRTILKTTDYERLMQIGLDVNRFGADEDSYEVIAQTVEMLPQIIQKAIGAGAKLRDIQPAHESLEKFYANIVKGE